MKMCGVFGCFSENKDNTVFEKIITSINSDHYNITYKICSESCLLGFMSTENTEEYNYSKYNHLYIVSYGNIYNEDILQIDKEILKLYTSDNLNQLKNFNGQFLILIYDSDKEKIIILNDRYGSIKLYYSLNSHCFGFSPKIKNLLDISLRKNIKKEAIIDFFTFGYILGNKTFFEDIYELPSGSILEFSKKGLEINQYWSYSFDEKYSSLPKDMLIDELATIWEKSIKRRINANEKIIIPLSGGLDSRAILAAALNITEKKNITTFTFGEPESFDFEIGKLIAKETGVRNIALEVEKENLSIQYNISLDDIEGMIDATPYHPIFTYKTMEKYGNKIYLGYMGDPIMGSHISKDMLNRKVETEEEYNNVKKMIYNKNVLYSFELIQQLLNSNTFKGVNWTESFDKTMVNIKECKNKDVSSICSLWDFNERQNKYVMYATFRFKQKFNIITPFLDNDLIDFMLKIPPKMRINTNLYKAMLLKKYPSLYKLPTKNNYGLALDSSKEKIQLQRVILFSKRKVNLIYYRVFHINKYKDKIKNYLDYDDFIRTNNEYKNYIETMLNKVKNREYFNNEFIEQIWESHLNGKKNYSMLFGLLVTFELLLEEYIDR